MVTDKPVAARNPNGDDLAAVGMKGMDNAVILVSHGTPLVTNQRTIHALPMACNPLNIGVG
jgi:hypothetical protein